MPQRYHGHGGGGGDFGGDQRGLCQRTLLENDVQHVTSYISCHQKKNIIDSTIKSKPHSCNRVGQIYQPNKTIHTHPLPWTTSRMKYFLPQNWENILFFVMLQKGPLARSRVCFCTSQFILHLIDLSVAQHTVTGHIVAMKFISKAVTRREKNKNRVRREYEYMRTLRHPHVIKLYAFSSLITETGFHDLASDTK